MANIKGIKTKSVNVNLDKLKLDLTNIRYQHLGEKLNDKKMEDLIWKDSSTRKLFDQIKSAKALYEEPIIDSENIVLEGNRRVVCLRRLKIEAHKGKLPGIKKDAFNIIKCRMIPANTLEVEKHLLLASIHVRPKLPWPAFNKAKYIYDLSSTHEVSYDKLTKLLAMGKATLIRMVKSYEQTYEYGKRYPDDDLWYRNYTYFEELFKRRDLKEFAKVQKNLDKFLKWVHEDKFTNVRDVRVLAQILEDKDALRIFEMHGFVEAFKFIQNKNPALKSKEFKQIQKTVDILRFFPRKELIKTIGDPHRKAIILKLKHEIDALVKDINMFDNGE